MGRKKRLKTNVNFKHVGEARFEQEKIFFNQTVRGCKEI